MSNFSIKSGDPIENSNLRIFKNDLGNHKRTGREEKKEILSFVLDHISKPKFNSISRAFNGTRGFYNYTSFDEVAAHSQFEAIGDDLGFLNEVRLELELKKIEGHYLSTREEGLLARIEKILSEKVDCYEDGQSEAESFLKISESANQIIDKILANG